MKKIFITGGHLAPAKAVISRLKKQRDWEIFYVGRKYAMEDDRALALEYQELGHQSYLKYISITAGRLQRKFHINIFQSFRALVKIPVGFVQAFWWLLTQRPAVVLSFGGYVAVPVVVGAWLLQIPVVTHEQTTVSGLANRIIASLAKRVLVSWESSLPHFPLGKAVLTGNPLREEILQKLRSNKVKSSRRREKMIYITGGNQGSHVINETVAKILPPLVAKYQVIHQTGDSQTHKDYQKLEKLRNKLPKKLQWRYQPYRFLSGAESATVLNNADLVVSRAGANIILELAALGKPAILIPIPWAMGNEQQKNAEVLAGLWMAEIIEQKDLTADTLLKAIEVVMEDIENYKKAAKEGKKLVHFDAAKKIVAEVNNVLNR